MWLKADENIGATLQDPKSSLWLWKKHERKKQKKRTVNYQHYLEMIRTDGNFLATNEEGDGNSFGHMTKKYLAQIENFLTYGQRNLDRRQIEKLKKENERKERVGGNFPNSELKMCSPDFAGNNRQRG